MLMAIPNILLGLVHHINGKWVLNENATEEQKKAFEKFKRDFKKAEESIFIFEN